MPPPRHPSRVDPLSFPVFGLSWFGNPGDGTSIVAYCGGGGSAKTGVTNKIIVRRNGVQDQQEISTHDHVCVAIHVYQNPLTNKLWMMGALGNSVVRYALPEGTVSAKAYVGDDNKSKDDGASAIAVNAMATWVAVGCESGLIYVFQMTDDPDSFIPVGVCRGHVKAVCALSFALRGSVLVSSAKDGTARVWNYETQDCLATLTCNVLDPKAPSPPKQPSQVLVRGCAFGDIEGKMIYTVASARRGKAYLYRWTKTPQNTFDCAERTECSPCPISAMSLSSDATLLALGGVDGTIQLYDTQTWKILRKYPEIHDLPVTCIAARPYALPLQGEEDGIPMHAISASADSQLALLTLQKRAPRKPKTSSSGGGGGNINVMSNTMIVWIGMLGWALYFIAQETLRKCDKEWEGRAWGPLYECIVHTVLIAPKTRPGIMVPPH